MTPPNANRGRDEYLRARAARALGNHRVQDAVAKVRAIIGPYEIPASEPLAQSALDKLHEGEVPTAEELVALEIVIRLLRPVILSQNCALGDLPDSAGQNLYPQELRDLWSDFRTRIQTVICSVGRIETATGQHKGTGFLVADGLLATNRHVLGALTFGADVLAPKVARVVFKQESGLPNSREDIVEVEGVGSIHPKLDMVLLRIPRTGRPAVEFAPALPREATRVVTIGYPAEDRYNNPLFLTGVFQGTYGVKRAALGEVLDGTDSPSLYHDCSTTQGNSGSPVFALDSARAVGIHRAGFFMYRNEAIDVLELRRFVDDATH